MGHEWSKVAAVTVLTVIVVLLITLIIVGIIAVLRTDAGSISSLFKQMAEIIEGSRRALPAWLVENFPANADELRQTLVQWLREHARDLRGVGTEFGRAFAHILIGMIIGAFISLRQARPSQEVGPMAQALLERAARVGQAFRRIVFAQVRISALNTSLTTIYLIVILPLCGVQLPLTKTMIAITFVAGLLPVIGNLISNTVIVVVSGLALSRARVARIPRRHSQARVFRERAHRGHPDPCARVGAADRDARHGSGVRDRGCGGRADLLCLPQGRAQEPHVDLARAPLAPSCSSDV
jgi:predicted PurR-regulated permease PerM